MGNHAIYDPAMIAVLSTDRGHFAVAYIGDLAGQYEIARGEIDCVIAAALDFAKRTGLPLVSSEAYLASIGC